MDSLKSVQTSPPETIALEAPTIAPLLKEVPDLPVITRSSPSFDELRATFDQTHAKPPTAIIRPRSETEVQAVVRYCFQKQILVVVITGGNDPGGRSCVKDTRAVLLDMRSLDTVVVSDGQKLATVGGGTTCGRLLQVLDQQGLTTPTAFAGGVGYTSWACGGGYGILAGPMGLGVDQIQGARVVLATGQVVDTADDSGDLLWALRGGGAALLGVIVQLRIKIYSRTAGLGGIVTFPLSEAPSIFGKLEELYARSGRPASFAGELMIINPPGSGGLLCFVAYWSLEDDKRDIDEAKAFLHSFAALGTVVANSVTETTPKLFTLSIPNPQLYGESIAYTVHSCCVDGWSSKLGRIFTQMPLPTATSSIVIHSSHGVAATVNDGASFYNRKSHLLIGLSGGAPAADEAARSVAASWAGKLQEDITSQGLAMDSGYINFSMPHTDDALWYFGAEKALRLRGIKDKLDPTGFWNHGVANFPR
ncbi:hypothetical protein QQS21_001273 [Conoideocrella luteorostrata]|uniref:FAD-binding PCMH-type domain-containing protein n=1 Tax=Conoideocrella luteorostrata TaxID=1105319 RepID=A0AAJ0CXF7_9HYPO|nr:hypothetical protein QQS21_001273 [Conoideocrella luteorostrata]